MGRTGQREHGREASGSRNRALHHLTDPDGEEEKKDEEEEKDTAKELERLLCLRLALGRYPPPRRVAGSLTERVAQTTLVRVGPDRRKKNSRPTGTPVTSGDHPDTKKLPTQKSDFHHVAKLFQVRFIIRGCLEIYYDYFCRQGDPRERIQSGTTSPHNWLASLKIREPHCNTKSSGSRRTLDLSLEENDSSRRRCEGRDWH